MKNALILLAGGEGKRLKSKEPKQFLKIEKNNLIEYFLSRLDKNIFDIIVIATTKKNQKKYLKNLKKNFDYHNIIFSLSGKTRQESSKKSLKKLFKFHPKKVLIHDAARPLVSNNLIKKILNTLDKNISAIPYIRYNDYIKTNNNIKINSNSILNIQTPQGFKFNQIYKAHENNRIKNSKDDSFILESKNIKLKFIKGEKTNLKITTKEDLFFFIKFKTKKFRSGIGYDIHKIDFNSSKKLILCGVKIDHPPLIGHSDADVGFHAVCDSILGSLSMKDIGYHFNNRNQKWKNANSKIFVEFCKNKLDERGYKIINLDINFICEKPNINKIANLMKKNLSLLLCISKNKISIKATTNEKIGLIGKGEGIAAQSIVQIVNE